MSGIVFHDDKEPDIVGFCGKAWKQDLESFKVIFNITRSNGSLSGWIVNCSFVGIPTTNKRYG